MRKILPILAVSGALLTLGLFVLAGCGDTITATDVSELDDEEALVAAG